MIRVAHRLALFLGCLLLFVPWAGAQSAKFEAVLSGSNQVPRLQTFAHGKATFELSGNGKVLHYRLFVADIHNVTMAHIHFGAAGKEGPIVAWLYPSQSPAIAKKGRFSGVLATGTITEANLMGPLQGKTIADLVADIKERELYVNVHTEAHPDGEIRGQIK